jgi:RNA 2',3'-cyclic 3'-phosphodiesterase
MGSALVSGFFDRHDISSMRTFIAIDLPEAIRAGLGRKQADFRAACESRPDERISWTRPEGIHLTLKFLGQVSGPQAEQVTEALRVCGPFERFAVEVKGFGFFPDARRPRVFWAGVEVPPALGELAARVEAAMQKLGFAPESRPFAPHLTLARFKNPRPQPALEVLLKQEGESSKPVIPAQAGIHLGRFEVSEFFLFESKLSPRGAEYRKIERFAVEQNMGRGKKEKGERENGETSGER